MGHNGCDGSQASGPWAIGFWVPLQSVPWRHMCKESGLSSMVISNALRKTRTQLGPSSCLDYRGGFTLSRFYTTF